MALALLVGACRPAGPAAAPGAAPAVVPVALPVTLPVAAPATVQPGAPGAATRVLSAEQVEQLRPPRHTAADVAFMQGMIPHHQQALEMAALVADRTTRREIRLLARRIEISQLDEINLMRSWLRQRNEALPPEGEHAGHGALMPGMLTPEEMATLAAAQGEAFDRHFLTFMIKHHEGAVRMVATLFGSERGGQQSEVNQFASDVESDQMMEIARMQKLLAER